MKRERTAIEVGQVWRDKRRPEQAAQAAGWEPHPDSADYFHNGVEAVEINVLRGMLGF
jgi:predicted metalloendopeptidase